MIKRLNKERETETQRQMQIQRHSKSHSKKGEAARWKERLLSQEF